MVGLLKRIICYEKGSNAKSVLLLTYCNLCRTNHSAWKMSRQSYNSEGITEGALWLGDGYGVVSSTSTSIHTVNILISSFNVVYTISHHSGLCGWCSPGDLNTGRT